MMESGHADASRLANVLWLVDSPEWQHALIVGRGPGPLSRAVAVRFANVELAVWPEAPDPTLPFRSEEFDLVALDAGDAKRADALARHNGTYIWRELLIEARRVLRTGGVLMVLGDNPRWFRTFLRGDRFLKPDWRVPGATRTGDLNAMSLNQVVATLRGCGWNDPHVLFAEPAGYAPRDVVPASHRAVWTNERLVRQRSLNSRIRSLVAAIGLQEMLYPTRIFIVTR